MNNYEWLLQDIIHNGEMTQNFIRDKSEEEKHTQVLAYFRMIRYLTNKILEKEEKHEHEHQ